MKTKILVVVFLILFSLGCINQKEAISNDTLKDTSNDIVKHNIKISSIIFTRTGIFADAKDIKDIIKAEVHEAGRKMEVQIDNDGKGLFINFNWGPNKKYEIKITTAQGNISSVAYSPGKPTAFKRYEIALEKVEPGNINRTIQNVKGTVRFSPDSRLLAVGTHGGYIRILRLNTGEIIFEKKISEGMISDVAFSQDGKYLFVAERSPDAFLYTFEVISGKEKWRLRAANDLGTDIKGNIYTSLNAAGDKIFFTASRVSKSADGKYYYKSKVYALDHEGQLLWSFPVNEIMDSGISSQNTAIQNYFAFGTSSVTPGKKYKEGTIYVLDAENGTIHWNYTISPLLPYFDSVIVSSVALSESGKTGIAVDGRAFLYENNTRLRQLNLSTPIEISGVPILGSVNRAYFIKDSVIFSIGSTYVPSKIKKKAPIEHPNSNSIAAYDLNGSLLWKWRIEGYSPELALGKRFLVVPVAQNTVTVNPDVHGIYVFDLKQPGGAASKLAYIYKTRGIVVAGDISKDERYIAAVEAPVRLEDGSVIGEYKVHVLN
ncbi:MAG: PQQ-binding-like beta-propeller repeat protein [Candidatus Methanoperedens sp.]|nr:PQQ-binding-like beta-propeller repeat protein [Candidatus Methanoperedens sp.]